MKELLEALHTALNAAVLEGSTEQWIAVWLAFYAIGPGHDRAMEEKGNRFAAVIRNCKRRIAELEAQVANHEFKELEVDPDLDETDGGRGAPCW